MVSLGSTLLATDFVCVVHIVFRIQGEPFYDSSRLAMLSKRMVQLSYRQPSACRMLALEPNHRRSAGSVTRASTSGNVTSSPLHQRTASARPSRSHSQASQTDFQSTALYRHRWTRVPAQRPLPKTVPSGAARAQTSNVLDQ